MDQKTEANLLANLEQELTEKTLILVTQKLSLLSLVDRVIVMHNSKVLMDDTKQKVSKKLQGSQNA